MKEKDYQRIAGTFWKSQNVYPAYDNIKRRRFYEINYVLNKIGFYPINLLVDLGCGDGGFVKCIDNLLQIKQIICYDYSDSLMSNINDGRITKGYFDCNEPAHFYKLPQCDLLMFGGVINYMFNDRVIVELMEQFKANHIFIRTPCTLKNQKDMVSTYSTKLQSDYVSLYRTTNEVLQLIDNAGLTLVEYSRIYPEDIESDYDTRQYMFYCTNNYQNV